MKIYLNNQDFSRMVSDLYCQIYPYRNKFKYIVGIERGGVPISSWLSYVFGKQHTSILVSLYGDNDKVSNTPIINLSNIPREPFLLVDDIVDKGLTLKIIETEKNLIRGHHFLLATLHWCSDNSPNSKPDFFVEIKKKEDWIVYQWEV